MANQKDDMSKTYEELYTPAQQEEIFKAGMDVPPKDEMTCNNCDQVTFCELAWDLYNTQGDCLAMK